MPTFQVQFTGSHTTRIEADKHVVSDGIMRFTKEGDGAVLTCPVASVVYVKQLGTREAAYIDCTIHLRHIVRALDADGLVSDEDIRNATTALARLDR